jgi:hypothetical protein
MKIKLKVILPFILIKKFPISIIRWPAKLLGKSILLIRTTGTKPGKDLSLCTAEMRGPLKCFIKIQGFTMMSYLKSWEE